MFVGQIDVIHGADEVNLSAYTYSAVYSESGSTVTINGTSVVIPTGLLIPVIIKSISSVPSVYCLGVASNTLVASPNL
jgi:hypothetical protein